MVSHTFINLYVHDLNLSKLFFSTLGFEFNEDFTDDTAAAMILNESTIVMLLTLDRFRTYTEKPISDAKRSTEVLISLQLQSRDEVDEMVKKAVFIGGKTYRDPEDHGFMYSHAFEDINGHQWEPFCFDADHIPDED
jgi:hypothetical protein